MATFDEYTSTIQHRNVLDKFFLTFPQSGNVEKQYFLDSIGDNILKYLVVQERHQDGNPHLHAIITYKKKCGKTKAQMLKLFQEKYPDDNKRIDVRSVRSMKKAILYLTKPIKNKYVDPEPLTNMELDKPKKCELLEVALDGYLNDGLTNTEKAYKFTLNDIEQHANYFFCPRCTTIFEKYCAEQKRTLCDFYRRREYDRFAEIEEITPQKFLQNNEFQ